MDRRLALAAALSLLPAVAAASGGEKKKGGGLAFLQIKSIVATIMRRNGSRGVVTVECGVDVPDDKLRALADASQPRLRAAYASFVGNYAASLAAAGVPDADYMAREMQHITDQVLGKKGAKFLVGTILIN
ncbi:MAG: Tat pathway signal protein [Caulobacter sp.]|nr:Tat pathway signal protein [Caulobacter sp.]